MRLFPVGIHFHVAGARQGIHIFGVPFPRELSERAVLFQGNQLRVNRFD
jgi:hypothetical protein